MMWELVKETYSDWSEDKASRLAAALAYYTIFSIAPLVIIVIAIAGLVFDRELARGQIQTQIQGLVGEDGAGLVQSMVEGASNESASVIATIIGVATLLFGASGVFGQLQDALNTIWEVEPKPGRGVMGIIQDRFISFTMVLGTGFLLMVSLVISAALAGLNEYLGGMFDNMAYVGEGINFTISLGVITLLFAMIYKILPDVEIAWSDVWVGAIVTALLFTIGKFLIGLYLGHSAVASTFGAAGSLVIIVIWIYYSAQILFMGAEFTQVYAKRFGSRIRPAPGARPVTEDTRAQQGMSRSEKEKPITSTQNRELIIPADKASPATKPALQPAPKPALATTVLISLLGGFILWWVLRNGN